MTNPDLQTNLPETALKFLTKFLDGEVKEPRETLDFLVANSDKITEPYLTLLEAVFKKINPDHIHALTDYKNTAKETRETILKETLADFKGTIEAVEGETDAEKKEAAFGELVKKIDRFKELTGKKALKVLTKEGYENQRVREFDEFIKYTDTERKGIQTGFGTLDDFLNGGLYPELHILGAESGTGKTTFALQIADYMAGNEGQEVIFFSREMSSYEIQAKSLSRISYELFQERGFTTRQFLCRKRTITEKLNDETVFKTQNKTGMLSKDELNEVIKHYESFYRRIRINDKFKNIDDIKEAALNHRKFTGTAPVIFIDYLQILEFKEEQQYEKRLEIDRTVSQLRILARDMQIPVILISSLNREGVKRNGGKVLYSLKESGGIEYAADIVIFLQAEREAEKNSEETGVDDTKRDIAVVVRKNRNGRSHSIAANEKLDFTFLAKANFFRPMTEAERMNGNEDNGNENTQKK